jgi:P4 family phage/plasmid primase-like protien
MFAFLWGMGGNGKSTFLEAITQCVGDYHRAAPIETFTASHTDRHPTDLAGLRGARLVTAIETDEGRHWAESKIKTLTGGDKISARFMRQDFFEYIPQFKLLIAGNHKPGLRSVDEAIRRRFNLIPFAVTIPKQDRQFGEKLKAEWPGILAWMIQGCLDWQQRGLNPPDAVTAATDAYLEHKTRSRHGSMMIAFRMRRRGTVQKCCGPAGNYGPNAVANLSATERHLASGWSGTATGRSAGAQKATVVITVFV